MVRPYLDVVRPDLDLDMVEPDWDLDVVGPDQNLDVVDLGKGLMGFPGM